jgi:hypothetical protein
MLFMEIAAPLLVGFAGETARLNERPRLDL